MNCKMEGSKLKLHILLYLIISALLFSCSGKTVLFINDPYFDSFASFSDKFYQFKKVLSFYKSGYRCDFVDPDESEDFFASVNESLKNGEYDALVTFYLSYHSLEIPEDLPVVLIGGSEEILYPSISHIVSSDIEALESAGDEIQTLWKEEGIIPLTIFWEKPVSAEEERSALLSSWNKDDREVFLENWLTLDINTSNSEQKLEDFFRKYDFETSNYIVFANCAPLYKEFIRTVPSSPELKFVLDIPDNPVLPPGTHALISEDYSGLISAAVKSLEDYSPGKIIKVENKFIRK